MALRSQLIEINPGGGLDERSASKRVPAARYKSLLNARWPNIGEVEKRFGSVIVGQTIDSSAIAINTTVTDACRLVSGGDHVVLLDGYRLCALKSQLNSTDLTNRGPVSEAVVTRMGVGGDILGATCIDVAYASTGLYAGNFIYAWSTGASAARSISMAVYNATTGAPVAFRQITTGSSGYGPRVIVCNGVIFVLYQDGTNLKCYDFAAATTTSLKTDVKYADSDVFLPYDVAVTATRFYIVYQTTGSTNVQIYGFDSSSPPVQKTSLSNTEATAVNCPGICATTGEGLWVTYYNGTNVKAFATNLAETTLSVTTAVFTIYTPGGTDSVHATSPARVTSTKAVVVIGCISNTTPKDGYMVAPCINTSGGVDRTGANSITRWCMPNSKPFFFSDSLTTGTVTTAYCWVTAGGADGAYSQAGAWGGSGLYSHVLVDLFAGNLQVGPARPVAISTTRFAITGHLAPLQNQKLLSSVASASTGQYTSGGLAAHDTLRIKNGCVALTANFMASNRWQPARAGDDLYLSGGILHVYDGLRTYESSFVYDPSGLNAVEAGSGSAPPSGSYSYVCCYAWTDAKGNVIRSAPSAPLTVTTTSGHNVTVTVPCLSLTTKQWQPNSYYPKVTIEIYRTTINSSGPYYLLTSVSNDTTANSTTYTDSSSDSSISSGPQLYTGLSGTDTSIVPNVCPPSFTALLIHNGSLWGIGDDQRTVWVSKPYVDGELIAWTDVSTIQFDEGNRLLALVPLDSVVLAFSATKIYRITGLPPTGAVGDGGSLVVDRVSSDYGCIEPRSVVSTPDGVVFQASGGYYFMDRGLNVSPFFGDEIQNELTSYPNVSSAVVHPTGKYLLMTVHAGSATGVRLVFDYRLKQWAVDQHRGTTANARICSSVVVGTSLYWIDNGGQIYREAITTDTNPYLDGGSYWITLQGELGEVNMNTLQGYQRCWYTYLLGTRYTAHDLTLEVAVDYSSTWQSKTWSDTVLSTLSLEQVRLDIVKQFSQSFRVRFTDASPTGGAGFGSGRGCAITSIMFDVGVHRGGYRVPSTQRA